MIIKFGTAIYLSIISNGKDAWTEGWKGDDELVAKGIYIPLTIRASGPACGPHQLAGGRAGSNKRQASVAGQHTTAPRGRDDEKYDDMSANPNLRWGAVYCNVPINYLIKTEINRGELSSSTVLLFLHIKAVLQEKYRLNSSEDF